MMMMVVITKELGRKSKKIETSLTSVFSQVFFLLKLKKKSK